MLRHRRPSHPAPTLSTPDANKHDTPASASASAPAYAPSLIAVALSLALVRFLSALQSPIADCDETFNYWEPMHYLLFKHGFQTWEYTPTYALRSYAYLLPYAAVARAAASLAQLSSAYLRVSSKLFAFYAVRCVQALVSVSVDTAFYAATRATFGNPIAAWLALFLLCSPGLFRASVEFLPSSFAMICLTAAYTAWMAESMFVAVAMVALASLLGWVYAVVLAIPMAIHMMYKRGVVTFVLYSILSAVVVLVFMVYVDWYFYGRTVITPLNHVMYNIFPPEGAGPHIFGTEPWTFYAINLILNSNVAILLVLSYFPLFFLHIVALCYNTAASVELWKRLIFLSPTYIWLAIFVSLPHKEERFLTPCYTFIALIAAVAINDWLEIFTRFFTTPSRRNSRLQHDTPKWTLVFKKIVCFTVVVLAITVSASRILMQLQAYSAPLQLYKFLSDDELRSGAGPKHMVEGHQVPGQVNICVGKEWYRFPTSFFLPDHRFRLRFVRDGFSGLLPKPFSEEPLGTRRIPDGMNALNIEDASQYYNASSEEGCHYFVDLDLSHRHGSAPATSEATVHAIAQRFSKVVAQYKMLDAEMSSAGYRAFFIPGLDGRLVYGQYQLIRNLELLPIAK